MPLSRLRPIVLLIGLTFAEPARAQDDPPADDVQTIAPTPVPGAPAPAAPGTTAATATPKPAAPEETKTSTTTALYIKGDLIHIGTRELVSRFNHVGVRIGPHIIGKDLFIGVTPAMAYYTGQWSFGFQVPLNLLGLAAGTQEFGGLKVRREDWDEASDYARLIRFITYGRKESNLYFTINSLRPTTLGHGQLMYNYQPNIDVDRSMTGVILEAYNDFGGFQAQVNDITMRNRLLGGLLFGKPLFFTESNLLRSLSLGVEYAGDLLAPKCLEASLADHHCVTGGPTATRPAGNQAGPDPLTGLNRDDTFIRTDPDLGRPIAETIGLHAIGFSGEMKVFATERSDIKAYLTFHQFLDAGNGFAAGFLGRFTTGEQIVHAFRARLEGRSFGTRFLPSYFDTLYEVSKYQFYSANQYQVTPTKYQAVFGDPEHGFLVADTGRKTGFHLEGSWAMYNGVQSKKQVAFGFGLSDSNAPNDTDFYVHAEVPVLRILELFASYLRLNAASPGDIFSSNVENLVILAGARVQILPFLFVDAHYSRAYQIIRGFGHELHLGNGNVVDENGKPSPYFGTDRIFESVQTLFVELELGTEFGGN